MWTPVSGCQHSRKHLRYGSDLTDAEWAIIAPLLPAPRRTGRPRRWADARAGECDFLRAALGLPLADGTNFAPHSTV
jgi:transposase